ncbi:probable mediator of RNA polymerase II transcription subunit 26a [Lolium rigidum]|uniref:probable mediator of RNA polymerase II transcription subunit 26a n=1 Tax=Lolium rigidum TaxID=89674 RepID=UPI001F5C8F58|nr:probable mediator of RNA polymerase II transcription subunit 26a [Lolium rigidum]
MADGLDRWRDFFRGAGAGICEVVEKAILVAAADDPREFLRRRDRIAERLFNALHAGAPPPHPPAASCHGSTTVSQPPATPAAVAEDKGSVRRVPETTLDSKVHSSSPAAPLPIVGDHAQDQDSDSDSEDDERLRRAAASNYGHTYDDDDEEDDLENLDAAAAAEDDEEDGQHPQQHEEEDQEAEELEALTNEIDRESQVVGEVLRIKDLLDHKQDYSDATLFDSLRRLQLMQLSVSALKATEIGRAVNGLRKHSSQRIRHLVQTLIQGWKVLVDEWVSTTNVALADNSPGTSNPSVVDDDEEEEGLPSPPLDEGAFFAPEATAIQLSEFFDEMDEDGNLRHNNDSRPGNKRENNGRRPSDHSAVAKPELNRPVGTVERDQFRRPELTRQEPSVRQTNQQKPQGSSLQARPHGMPNRQSRPPSSDSGSMRPKVAPHQKPIGDMKYKETLDHFGVDRKPAMGHVDKSRLHPQTSAGVRRESAKPKINDGLEGNVRLEAAKRKLQERYQELEKAKKQRTIQVMELGDIPKPKNHNRQPVAKSRNNIRSRVLGRR